jgi:hypothetical protein
VTAVQSLGEVIRQRQVLALSDERDLWRAFAIELANESYATGYADGQAAEQRKQDRAWAAQPLASLAAGPPLAELRALRADHGRLCRCPEHRAGTGRAA